MLVYLIMYFILIIFFKFINTKKINLFDILLIIMLILVSGLRYAIGTDYMMYKSFYFNVNLPNAEKVETGFKILINIVKNVFGYKFWYFFVICAAISIIPIYYVIKKKSKYPAFTLIMFVSMGFYTLSFNMVRQFVAIAICIIALEFIYRKNFIAYVFTIIFASFFHITALIMIPAYFIGIGDFKSNTLLKIFIIELFVGILFNPIFNFLVSHISQYAMYAKYGGTTPGIGTYLLGGIYLFLIFVQIKFYEKFVKNEFEKCCLNLSILAVPFIVFSIYNVLFARIIYYFLIPALIPFSNILNFFKIKRTQKAFNVFIIMLLLVVYILNIVSFNGVFPYKSVIGKKFILF